jgi:hypothetical protein
MSYVLDILDETKWDAYLYHATDKSFDPKKMKSGSHLGTLHAAVSRAKANVFDNRDIKVHAYKYHSPGKSIEIEDDNFSDPDSDAHSIATQLSLKGHIHGRQWKEITRAPEGKKVQALGNVLKRNGISSLHYKNRYEDKGSTSHMVFDPENLHHVHTFHNPKVVER